MWQYVYMSRVNRNQMIESLFLDIAKPGEMEIVNKLYNEGNKGSAIVYQLRRIREKWVELFLLEEKVKIGQINA